MVAQTDPNESAMLPGGVASVGQRIAGAILIVNAIGAALELILLPELAAKVGLPGAGRIAPAVFDLVIGGSMLFGSDRLVTWAIVRVAIGLLLYSGMALAQSDALQAALQVGFSVALLVLLIGRAGRARLVIGSALAGAHLLLTALGFYALLSGHNPMAGAVLGLKGEIERGVAGEVKGEASAYSLQAPADGWSLRAREAAKRDNPLADIWLIRPDRDAHVVVIDEQMAGMVTPVDRLTDVVIANGEAAAGDYRVISREPLPGRPDDGRLLRVEFSTGGQELAATIALVAAYGHNYQVLGLAPRVNRDAVADEILAIVTSFTPPPPSLPDSVVPGPAGRVTGKLLPYAITGASERWYLRTDAAAKADNPLADVWLIRPDRDAHVFVIAEELPEALTLDAFATIVQDNLRANGRPVTLGEPRPDGRGGLLFHASLEDPNMGLEFDYDLHVAGKRVFQVVGFCHQAFYPALKDELLRTLGSFEPPTEG